MKITYKEQAVNAIQWIDALPNYKQAPFGRRGKLGDIKRGFCCLGVGCYELGVNYNPASGLDFEFSGMVGLRDASGILMRDGYGGYNLFYGQHSLARINDLTNAGFKRIAKLLKTKPQLLFKPEVAKLIEQHYQEVSS